MSTSVYVCLCVCMSVCPWGYLRNYKRHLYHFLLCMLPMDVARSSSGRVTKSQGGGTVLGFSSPLIMYCNAFAAKGIIQSPVTPCIRKDHSVCQASAKRNPENLSAGDTAYCWEGGDGSAQRGRSMISMIALLLLRLLFSLFISINKNRKRKRWTRVFFVSFNLKPFKRRFSFKRAPP